MGGHVWLRAWVWKLELSLSPQPCRSPAAGAWTSHLSETSPSSKQGQQAHLPPMAAVKDATESAQPAPGSNQTRSTPTMII